MTCAIFLYIETLILLFLFIYRVNASGPKKLVDYKIVQITIPDSDGNVRIEVNKFYSAKHKKLIISKVLMATGSYTLGAFISLPE